MSERRESGLTLVEVVIASTVLAIVVLGAVMAAIVAMREIAEAREAQVARLAAQRAIQMLATVKFRAASSSDATEWLFKGGYEIARNSNGTTFVMPDVRTVATTTDDNAISGSVLVEFPVPGLTPPSGRTYPGRIYFYVNETTQPSSIPTAAFPFPSTTTPTALTKLDCDGDGAVTTTNLRVKYSDQTYPCRLVPLKVLIEWRGQGGATERYEEHVLLAYQGFE